MPAEASRRRPVHRLHRFRVGDVDLHAEPADLVRDRLRRLAVDVRDDDLCTSSVKSCAASAPMPPPAPVITQTLPSSRPSGGGVETRFLISL